MGFISNGCQLYLRLDWFGNKWTPIRHNSNTMGLQEEGQPKVNVSCKIG